jgi:hypothetical protein
MRGNPFGYEQNWTIEQHRDELVDRLGEAIRQLSVAKEQVTQQAATIKRYEKAFENVTRVSTGSGTGVRRFDDITKIVRAALQASTQEQR